MILVRILVRFDEIQPDLNNMRKQQENEGDGSHVNQLALLMNMTQDVQDHEAPAAAIFVLQASEKPSGLCLTCSANTISIDPSSLGTFEPTHLHRNIRELVLFLL